MTALSIPCTSHEQALAVIQHGWAVVDGDWIERWKAAGKPRIEVTAPCGRGCKKGVLWSSGGSWPCVCTDGWLHVGWVTVTEVLPVFGVEASETPPFPYVFADAIAGVWAIRNAEDCTLITADVAHLGNPGDLVGRFLLKIEVVA